MVVSFNSNGHSLIAGNNNFINNDRRDFPIRVYVFACSEYKSMQFDHWMENISFVTHFMCLNITHCLYRWDVFATGKLASACVQFLRPTQTKASAVAVGKQGSLTLVSDFFLLLKEIYKRIICCTRSFQFYKKVSSTLRSKKFLLYVGEDKKSAQTNDVFIVREKPVLQKLVSYHFLDRLKKVYKV